MYLRTIALLSATAVLLFGIGAIAASAVLVVAGLSVGLVASLVVSIKTDDPTRSMQELLLEHPSNNMLIDLAEDRAAA